MDGIATLNRNQAVRLNENIYLNVAIQHIVQVMRHSVLEVIPTAELGSIVSCILDPIHKPPDPNTNTRTV